MASFAKLFQRPDEQARLRLAAELGAQLAGERPPARDAGPGELLDTCVRSFNLLRDRIDAERAQAAVAGDAAERTLAATQRAQAEIAKELVIIGERVRSVLVAAPGEADTRVLVRWLGSRLDPLLEVAGVTAFSEMGRFDAARHEVIETRPAPSGELAGTIAETVRPGLMLGDDLLRPQLVAVYEARP